MMATRLPLLVSVFNPVARRLLRGGIPLGPNTLLTVRGRKSGQPRTTGVALVKAEGRRWVVGTYGEGQWTQNLRAAGEGRHSRGRHKEPVEAVEMDPEEAPAIFKDVLGPYDRRIPF